MTTRQHIVQEFATNPVYLSVALVVGLIMLS